MHLLSQFIQVQRLREEMGDLLLMFVTQFHNSPTTVSSTKGQSMAEVRIDITTLVIRRFQIYVF